MLSTRSLLGNVPRVGPIIIWFDVKLTITTAITINTIIHSEPFPPESPIVFVAFLRSNFSSKKEPKKERWYAVGDTLVALFAHRVYARTAEQSVVFVVVFVVIFVVICVVVFVFERFDAQMSADEQVFGRLDRVMW